MEQISKTRASEVILSILAAIFWPVAVLIFFICFFTRKQ